MNIKEVITNLRTKYQKFFIKENIGTVEWDTAMAKIAVLDDILGDANQYFNEYISNKSYCDSAMEEEWIASQG